MFPVLSEGSFLISQDQDSVIGLWQKFFWKNLNYWIYEFPLYDLINSLMHGIVENMIIRKNIFKLSIMVDSKLKELKPRSISIFFFLKEKFPIKHRTRLWRVWRLICIKYRPESSKIWIRKRAIVISFSILEHDHKCRDTQSHWHQTQHSLGCSRGVFHIFVLISWPHHRCHGRTSLLPLLHRLSLSLSQKKALQVGVLRNAVKKRCSCSW